MLFTFAVETGIIEAVAMPHQILNSGLSPRFHGRTLNYAQTVNGTVKRVKDFDSTSSQITQNK